MRKLQVKKKFLTQKQLSATNKNLGPAVIEFDECLKRVFEDHLLDDATYRQLSSQEAAVLIAGTSNALERFLDKHSKKDDGRVSHNDLMCL